MASPCHISTTSLCTLPLLLWQELAATVMRDVKPALDKDGIKLVAVGIGYPEIGREFCELTGEFCLLTTHRHLDVDQAFHRNVVTWCWDRTLAARCVAKHDMMNSSIHPSIRPSVRPSVRRFNS
jgi:hypothetical protein